MAMAVCGNAMLTCSFGTAPSTFMVTPQNKTKTTMPLANIMDNKPLANIMPFAMCNSPANPATLRPPPVFFTPAPCMPVIAAPWAPGSTTVMIANMPALNSTSKCMCNWGGVIQITNPGTTNIQVP